MLTFSYNAYNESSQNYQKNDKDCLEYKIEIKI